MTPTEQRDYLVSELTKRGEFGLAILASKMHETLEATASGCARDAERSAARVEDFWTRRIVAVAGAPGTTWDVGHTRCDTREAAERTLDREED